MDVARGILILVLVTPAVYAVDYMVGDSNNWALGVDYNTWVAGKTFNVGDNLVFKYGSSHSVDVVSSSDYQSCKTSSPLKHYTGGNNKIPLGSVGQMYFICPTPGHCAGGMKLAVPVSAASITPATPTTPSPSTSPSSGSSSTPTPSSNATTPSTTKSGAARNSCNNINALVIGLGVFLVCYTVMG